MPVALISAVNPFPTDAGKKVVLAGFLRYFSDRQGTDNIHYLLLGSGAAGFPVQAHQLRGPTRFEVAANILTRVATRRSSLQEAFLRTSDAPREIDHILEDISPQTVIYDTIRMAQFAGDRAATSICYLDDLFSERYGAMLAASREYPDVDIEPLGNFAEHIPRRLRPIAASRRGQLALLHAERALVRRSEDRTAQAFGRSLLVSPREAHSLSVRANVPAGRVQALPPLVDVPTSVPSVRSLSGAPTFVFLGLLSLPHNDDGLSWFLSTAWPLVIRNLPDARLLVIGRNARPELLELAGRSCGVSVEGYVADLSSALSGAAALVNPLRFGSGIKLKVIESLARGLPVVSTSVGAEGIASGPDHGILVGDSPAEIADLMCELTVAPTNHRLSEAARSSFDETYATPAVYARYDEAFSSV